MCLQFHRSRVRGPGASNAPQCPTKAKGIVPGRVSRKQIWTETNIYEVLKHKHILQRFMGWEPGSLGGCEETMWKMMGVTESSGPRRESKSPGASYHGNELQWKSESTFPLALVSCFTKSMLPHTPASAMAPSAITWCTYGLAIIITTVTLVGQSPPPRPPRKVCSE